MCVYINDEILIIFFCFSESCYFILLLNGSLIKDDENVSVKRYKLSLIFCLFVIRLVVHFEHTKNGWSL